MNTGTAPTWQEAIFRVLKEGGTRQIAYVPDAGHSHLIKSAIADPDIADVVLGHADIAKRIQVRRGLCFAQVFIESNEPPRALPPRDGPYVKNRFRAALGLKPF